MSREIPGENESSVPLTAAAGRRATLRGAREALGVRCVAAGFYSTIPLMTGPLDGYLSPTGHAGSVGCAMCRGGIYSTVPLTAGPLGGCSSPTGHPDCVGLASLPRLHPPSLPSRDFRGIKTPPGRRGKETRERDDALSLLRRQLPLRGSQAGNQAWTHGAESGAMPRALASSMRRSVSRRISARSRVRKGEKAHSFSP